MTPVRTALTCTLLAALSVVPRVTRADEDLTQACAASHLSAQKERRDHRLKAARQALASCARETCPSLIRNDCAGWLSEVEAELPSIVIEARDAAGGPLRDAQITIDGLPFRGSLAANEVSVDPGEHVIGLTVPGRAPVEHHVLARQGEHARPVVLVAPEPPAPELAPARPWAVPVALAAVSLVGVGLFAGFGAAGLGVKNDLDAARCKPACDGDRVAVMRRDFLLADASLVVAVAALGAASLAVVLSPARAPAARLARGAARSLAEGVRF
ncbi:MAG: hypothetical protein JWP97_5301 [Labilithrix sp.]|nr:hypothetical protein [Labilithrix sp.]